MVPHTRNRKRLKVDLGQVNPETFQHAGHKSWGGGRWSRGDLERFRAPQPLRPPGPSSWASWPHRARRLATSSGHRPLHCEAEAPRPQTGHLLSRPPPKPSTPILRPQTPLRTRLLEGLGRSGPIRRGHPPQTSSLAGADARLPFLLLVSCHCRRGAVRRQTPELPGRWGFQSPPSLLPSPTPCGPGGC